MDRRASILIDAPWGAVTMLAHACDTAWPSSVPSYLLAVTIFLGRSRRRRELTYTAL